MGMSVSKRLIIVSFLLVALASVLVYASVGQRATDGTRLMPLDDAYIHFQYAKQLAQGQPYAYNTGQAPTSGATSLLYPYLLAMGYGLGFIDLSVGLWAMLLGGISLFWAMWACFRLGQWLGLPDAMAWWTALVFGLCGSIAWHAMSGMETMLMMLAILWVGVGVLTKDVRTVAFWGVMLTVIRPEGGIVSAIGVFVLLVGFWRDGVLWPYHGVLGSDRQPKQVYFSQCWATLFKPCCAYPRKLWAHVVGIADGLWARKRVSAPLCLRYCDCGASCVMAQARGFCGVGYFKFAGNHGRSKHARQCLLAL